MSEIYVVLPLTTPQGPTPHQVLSAVEGLPDMRITVLRSPAKQRILIDVTPARYEQQRPAGSGTEVNLSGVAGDDTPCELSFRGGTPALVATITRRIAAACGPQVVFPASGADPLVCIGEPIL